MAHKEIIYKEEARKTIFEGIKKAAQTVVVTMGPLGRNAILERTYGGPQIINDGVSIVREVALENKFENMGVDLVKEVANKTNDRAGDGTTTSIILMKELVEQGLQYTALGTNVVALRRGMELALKDAVSQLKAISQSIDSDKKIQQVATVSVEDDELGKKIAETIKVVGKDGVVTVEESQSFGIESEIVEGLEIDKGYASPYMITNSERMEADHKKVSVLLTDKTISSIKDILPFIEKMAQAGLKDVVIIAEDVTGEALATLVVNRLRGAFNVLAIKAPGFGDRKKDILEDIAVVVGAEVVSSDKGMTFENADLSVLGKASRVLARKDSSVIVGGDANKKAISERVEQLKAQVENTTSKFDKEKLLERIAKLTGGVAVLRVGAATESEMKYLKLKVEDAVNATKAAIEEGVVSGGGSALYHIKKKLENNISLNKNKDKKEMREELWGYEIVINALSAPMKQILSNSGISESDAAQMMYDSGEESISGIDVATGEMQKDMFSAGIIDPLKVTRSALESAVSAAAIFLTTDVAVVDVPDKESKEMPPMGGPQF